MVKLTVMYNLPPGTDHEEFIRWRTTEHQANNMAIPGVIEEAWRREDLPYRYMTEAYFPDMESFRKSFFDPAYQAELAEALKKIVDPLFLISEEVLSASVEE
jgi:hypothetical protein